jgi:hypothetical protein
MAQKMRLAVNQLDYIATQLTSQEGKSGQGK